MKDYQGDYEPSYTAHLSQRATAMVRATTIFCLTIFIVAGMGLFFAFYSERFTIVGSDHGVYVFDRKDVHLNHCDQEGTCRTVMLAKSPSELAAVAQQNIMGQPGQSITNGGLLTGFNQQQNPCVQTPGTSSTPTIQEGGILGVGLPKMAPMAVIQGQMNAAQQQINTASSLQQQSMAMPQQMPQQLPPQSGGAGMGGGMTQPQGAIGMLQNPAFVQQQIAPAGMAAGNTIVNGSGVPGKKSANAIGENNAEATSNDDSTDSSDSTAEADDESTDSEDDIDPGTGVLGNGE